MRANWVAVAMAGSINRYLGVFADCQRAMKHRLEDGTWLSF
jgi:hypothetical protein